MFLNRTVTTRRLQIIKVPSKRSHLGGTNVAGKGLRPADYIKEFRFDNFLFCFKFLSFLLFSINLLTPTILWSTLPSNIFFPLHISSEKLILDEDKKKKNLISSSIPITSLGDNVGIL